MSTTIPETIEARPGQKVRSQPGTPTWEMAHLYPQQGSWTERDYLTLDANSNRLIELSDGCLEFLSMPTAFHQFIVRYLYRKLDAFVEARRLGEVLFAPLPVRLWEGKLREPDVMYFRSERLTDHHEPPNGVDLAIEVVSPGEEARKHDLQTKRQEYAEAGIPEYWIVDPETRRITVLTLKESGQPYEVHGEFGPGTKASSVLLPDFEVAVDDVFAAGEDNQTSDT